MFGFLNRNTNNSNNNMVMLTEADIKKLKNSHGVVLFFMNGCGHCVDMKDDWNAAVDECRNNGIGSGGDDFVLGAVESGNTDMFQKHGITTSVNGYPTILYINAEGIQRGDTNHEKYENPREKNKFIEWIKEKKNKKVGKMGTGKGNKMKQMKQSGGGNGSGSGSGGRRKTYRRKTKSKRYSKRHTRRRSRRNMKRGGCGCGSKFGVFS